MGDTASIARRRNDDYRMLGRQDFDERVDAWRVDTVVVGYENARKRTTLGGNEVKGETVDAVPQMRRRGAIVEDVPQVPAATLAVDLRPLLDENVIGLRARRVWQHVPERRPSVAAVVFRFRGEDGQLAPGATIEPQALFTD